MRDRKRAIPLFLVICAQHLKKIIFRMQLIEIWIWISGGWGGVGCWGERLNKIGELERCVRAAGGWVSGKWARERGRVLNARPAGEQRRQAGWNRWRWVLAEVWGQREQGNEGWGGKGRRRWTNMEYTCPWCLLLCGSVREGVSKKRNRGELGRRGGGDHRQYFIQLLFE